MKDTEQEKAIKEWQEMFKSNEFKKNLKERIPLTPRQLLAEAQENKVKQERRAIENSDLEYRILEQLNREFDNLKENTDALTVGDRLAVLKQLTTLVAELQ